MRKPHAHLQTMTLTPVKFQRNWSKTVGGDLYTRYLILKGGQKDGRKDRRMENRKDGMMEY